MNRENCRGIISTTAMSATKYETHRMTSTVVSSFTGCVLVYTDTSGTMTKTGKQMIVER